MIIQGEVYYIQSRWSGKQVDVYGCGTNNGTNIHLWTLNKTNVQKFRVIKDGSYYSFLSLWDENKAIDGGEKNLIFTYGIIHKIIIIKNGKN